MLVILLIMLFYLVSFLPFFPLFHHFTIICSSSKSIFFWFFTSSFTLFIKSFISLLVALFSLIIKFACLLLTFAPPTEIFFKLHSSINLPADKPFGFLNTEPADGYSKGWLFFLFSKFSFIISQAFLVSPFSNLNMAQIIIILLFLNSVLRYSYLILKQLLNHQIFLYHLLRHYQLLLHQVNREYHKDLQNLYNHYLMFF